MKRGAGNEDMQCGERDWYKRTGQFLLLERQGNLAFMAVVCKLQI